MTRPIRYALGLAFALVLPNAAQASEATELAAKVIAAYGGAEALERAGSFKQTGKLNSFRHGKTGKVERTYSRPDKLRISIQIPGEPAELRIIDGDRGWRDGQEVTGMMARAMSLQAARLDLPWRILMAGTDIKMFRSPGQKDAARGLEGLEVPMPEGLRVIAVIDAKTGYIVGSRGLISVGPGYTMEFKTLYAAHALMNGAVVAREEAHFAQGQATGETVLDKLEIIDDISNLFVFPQP